MTEHTWTLYIITYIDIQFNSRLVKTQHIIPDSHNHFIENLTVKLIQVWRKWRHLFMSTGQISISHRAQRCGALVSRNETLVDLYTLMKAKHCQFVVVFQDMIIAILSWNFYLTSHFSRLVSGVSKHAYYQYCYDQNTGWSSSKSLYNYPCVIGGEIQLWIVWESERRAKQYLMRTCRIENMILFLLFSFFWSHTHCSSLPCPSHHLSPSLPLSFPSPVPLPLPLLFFFLPLPPLYPSLPSFPLPPTLLTPSPFIPPLSPSPTQFILPLFQLDGRLLPTEKIRFRGRTTTDAGREADWSRATMRSEVITAVSRSF